MMRRVATRLSCLLALATLVGTALAADPVPGPAPQQLIETTAGGSIMGSRVAWKLGTIAPGASGTVSVSLKPIVMPMLVTDS